MVKTPAVAACLAAGLIATSPRPLSSQMAGPSTGILSRARVWAGAAGLERVRSIVVTVHRDTARSQFRLRWPAQFQTRYVLGGQSFAETPASEVWANTLDGKEFWQRFPRPVPPENAARARRGSASSFATVALTYLLQPPPGQQISTKTLGIRNFGRLEGQALLVTDSTGKHTVFVFDSGSGALTGYVDDATAEGAMRAPTAHLIVRLDDFRQVSGVKFPFGAEEYWAATPGEPARVTKLQVDDIALNTLVDADFKRSRDK